MDSLESLDFRLLAQIKPRISKESLSSLRDYSSLHFLLTMALLYEFPTGYIPRKFLEQNKHVRCNALRVLSSSLPLGFPSEISWMEPR